MKILIDDNIATLDFEAALPLLSEQRREHVMAIRNEEQRRQSVAAYLLLCRALGPEFAAPTFDYTEHGKPLLREHPDIHFSISHCRGAVAVAVDNQPVGIDIERADRKISDALIRHTMNDAEELQIAQSANPTAAFIRLWTMKEALMKMTGEGIQGGLRDVLERHPDAVFAHHDRDGLVCTVATRSL